MLWELAVITWTKTARDKRSWLEGWLAPARFESHSTQRGKPPFPTLDSCYLILSLDPPGCNMSLSVESYFFVSLYPRLSRASRGNYFWINMLDAYLASLSSLEFILVISCFGENSRDVDDGSIFSSSLDDSKFLEVRDGHLAINRAQTRWNLFVTMIRLFCLLGPTYYLQYQPAKIGRLSSRAPHPVFLCVESEFEHVSAQSGAASGIEMKSQRW